MFSKRQIDILLLLGKTKEPVTADWIAKELDVSDRTVRNEIKLVQEDSAKLGISIDSCRGKGYQIQVLDHALFLDEFSKLIQEKQGKPANNFSNLDERVVYLLKRLLLEKQPIKVENLEDEMFVSKSTIQNDLKIVRPILAKYNLKLANRPHYGIHVEGDEYMKRLCLSNNIITRNDDLSVDPGSIQLFDQDIIKKIKEIIIKKVDGFKIEISDISLENLATHIAIACKRIEEGFIIEHLKEQFLKEYPFETFVAKEIVEEVQNITGLSFPESEIDYIIVHLLGTKLLQKKELTEFSEFDEVGSIVQCMLDRLKSELNWDFQDDIEFIQALTLHIRPAMNRLRYKMNIRNPLLQEIKVKYPSAFQGAVIASKCIEEYLSIEPGEHEIAYIALHIGVALERMKSMQKRVKRVIVVCASGVGSAKLLYYRIKNLFENELEIIDSINYYKLSGYDLSSVDFIISTIPIKEDLGIPIKVVNTFLGEEDINQIKSCLNPGKQDRLSDYLDSSRVFVHQELDSKQSVLSFLCNELMKQKLVPRDYEKLVLEREVLAPTSFGNLVAIPHPIVPVTDGTFWTVCTLKSPIHWQDSQMVQLICLLNIQKGPKGNLDNMYEKLIKVIENKTIVQKIIKSQSVPEIINLLNGK